MGNNLIEAGLHCPYCDIPTVLTECRADFRYTYRHMYRCPGCGAFVLCHPGTTRAMGSVADSELRCLRHVSHIWFDAVWRNKLKRSRYNAYSWLALRLNMNKNDVHMGRFDKEMCLRVIDLCSGYIRKKSPIVYDSVTAQVREYTARAH